jgi:hypothetical protein
LGRVGSCCALAAWKGHSNGHGLLHKKATPLKLNEELYSNIFVPQVCMHFDEVTHHLNAFSIIEDNNTYIMLPKQVFSSPEITVFADNDPRNSEE